MKPSRRIAAIALREVKAFAAHAAMRAGRRTAEIRTPGGFRLLTEDETKTLLGGELLAALCALYTSS